MLKLYKNLKPYILSILVIILLIGSQAILNLKLPDYTARLISESIISPVYEKNSGGNVIVMKTQDGDMPVFVFNYQVKPSNLLYDDNGNAYVDPLDPFYTYEENGEVKIVYFCFNEQEIPCYKYVRENGEVGVLKLDKNNYATLKQDCDFGFIAYYGVIMIFVTLAITITGILGSYVINQVSAKFARDIRAKLFRKLNDFAMMEIDRFGTASLVTRCTNDITQLQQVTIFLMRMLVFVPLMFIGGLIMALMINAQMTLVLLISIPVILTVVFGIAKVIIPLFKSMQKKIDRLTLVSRENLTGVRVIKAFGREQTERVRFINANKEVCELAIKTNRIMSVLLPFVVLVMSLTSVGIVAIAVYIAKKDIMAVSTSDFADMMAVMQYVMQIMFSIMMIMMMFIMIPRASASASRINEVLDTQPSIVDKQNPMPLPSHMQGVIEFDNVTFSFTQGAKPVIKNISFTAKPNTTTAIIGSTGSGKSTIINLIPRFYETSIGSVRIDNIEVSEFRQKDLRSKIGFVPQTAVLFSGTIRDNIKFGNDEATDEMIWQALEIANAKEFVENAGGLDAKVEKGGLNFSGGQKQRLSIARAVVRHSCILIFDDSFSALDFKTDASLRASLKANIKDCTIIIVAQRIGTILDADQIIVLDEGKIVGCGKHKQLMKTCEVYRQIALSQLSEQELDF